MSKNEVGFFLPIRLIRHASGRGGAGGAFPGYLGAVLVCPKHLGPGAPWSKTEDQNITDVNQWITVAYSTTLVSQHIDQIKNHGVKSTMVFEQSQSYQ